MNPVIRGKPYPAFDSIDMGIPLCNFDLACKELELEGKYEQLEDFPISNELKYVI